MKTLQAAHSLLAMHSFYMQGGQGLLLYAFTPQKACISMKQLFFINYQIVVTHYKKDSMTWYLSKTAMKQLVDFYLSKQKNDPLFLRTIIEDWETKNRRFHDFVSHILSQPLASLDAESLASLFQELFIIGEQQWQPFIFIDAFDELGAPLLLEELEKYAPHLSKEIVALTFPDEFSYVQKERMDFLAIAEDVCALKQEKTILAAKKFSSLPLSLQDRISRHQQRYFWYKNNYGHIVFLDISYFFKELQHLLSTKNPPALKNEKQRMITDLKMHLFLRQKYMKLLPSSLHSLFSFFQCMTLLRDKRKENSMTLVTVQHILLEHLSDRLNVDLFLLERILPSELTLLFTSKKTQLLKELKKREEALIIATDDNILLYTEKDAAFLKKSIDNRSLYSHEVKGMIASKGTARGFVKIINKVSEFSKFNKGDILVSIMTRPEFLPIMEKAAAIVTDEGGITSHAAIVSRELGIPCIVGTQTATRILKDGQKVEVDAVKGIVKIL